MISEEDVHAGVLAAYLPSIAVQGSTNEIELRTQHSTAKLGNAEHFRTHHDACGTLIRLHSTQQHPQPRSIGIVQADVCKDTYCRILT
jgi:hypothetical protein